MLSSKLNLRGVGFTRSRRHSIIVSALFAVCFLFNASGVFAATFVVNSTDDINDATPGDGTCLTAGGVCTLRAAISEANAFAGADVITLPAGTYTITLVSANENNNLGGDFDLNTEITINGAGSASTIVQAAASRGVATERVFHLRASFVMALNDMTIRYGRYTTSTFGAGIRVDAAAPTATLNRVVVTENDDFTSGGGIAVSGTTAGASLTLNNCTVSNNTAGSTAATSSNGAGIQGNATTATININNSTITGNTVSNTSTAVSAAGGGVSSVGTLNITDSMITNNTATSSGNNALSGGVYVTAGTTTITGSTISGNSSTVTAGTGSGQAGGIYNQATVSIINSTVSNNTASHLNGGIRTIPSIRAAMTNIINSTVSGNTAVSEGGGVGNINNTTFNATTNITGSAITGNMATSGTSVGGGVVNFTTSTGLGTVNISNSTVGGNSAANAAGVYNSGGSAVINLQYSTVASNTATTNGGGLFQDTTGTTNLFSSIVADNTAGTGPDIFGVITSQNYNHVENITGGTFVPMANDVTGTDPQLTALALNGGTTLNYLPAATSPVIDTIPGGMNSCGVAPFDVDQRGIMRPTDSNNDAVAGCEKGSVEVVAPTAAATSVSGRVLTGFDGRRGVANAMVKMTDAAGVTRFARTNAFGYFRLDDVATGQTYLFDVSSKRYEFQTQVVNVNNELTDLDFTPLYHKTVGK